MASKGVGNPVSAPGVGVNMPLVTVDLLDIPNQLSVAINLKWPSGLLSWAMSQKKREQRNQFKGSTLFSNKKRNVHRFKLNLQFEDNDSKKLPLKCCLLRCCCF